MFNKVLIANRGAIACRIIRTLNKLNIQSVAVFAESDEQSLHVAQATESYCLGNGPAQETYLNQTKLLDIAKQTGAEAIHPGYGFLSENAEFVSACEQAGIVFIGPTQSHILDFGLKHRARELAENAQVPLLPGSDVLENIDQAVNEAAQIGYPVMLKSSAGGGGIGMQLCETAEQLQNAFESVKRLGEKNFSDNRVFLEKFIARARHIEVQVFADGQGNALAIGERDCSSQRRNQKVVEECPAPNLNESTRTEIHKTAEKLLASVAYRNAGTVEFIFDDDTQQFYFLEVNTRLQVEHGVTEEVYNIDLVEMMLTLASGDSLNLNALRDNLSASGHAIQVRIYAEDPYKNFQPAAGLLTQVEFPHLENLRIDHWIESGVTVSPYFDPMLAKVISFGDTRDSSLSNLQAGLSETKLYGIATNLDYLTALLSDSVLQSGKVTTRYLNDFSYAPQRIDVISAGTQTTVQDFPARQGYWDVGVPPSGPFDNYSFRLANKMLGNPDNAAGLEIVIQGPTLEFSFDITVVITGADVDVLVDNEPASINTPIQIKSKQILTIGKIKDNGARCYLAVAGGIDCPDYLGSKSTFTLGQFGGHAGRALRVGDILSTLTTELDECTKPAPDIFPNINNDVELRVIYGPHGAPDFFTDDDITTFFETQWEVHYNSSRTGIRLIGPKPQWARENGGEAGLHPSNIHDNAYAFGTVDFTGDMPVILGPDGPSLGGFVCPATVVSADLWKLGQLKSGNKIRFIPVSIETAKKLEAAQIQSLETLSPQKIKVTLQDITSPIYATLSKDDVGEDIVYRLAGDHFLLVEYGDLILDIPLRLRAHALQNWLIENPKAGIKELTPGIRSLQIHFDSQQLSHEDLVQHLSAGEKFVSENLSDTTIKSRIVHLPLSWDDKACHEAIEKYQQSVRPDAPWCPSNLEFIQRINGLESIDAVKKIVFDASYLVMGLGDVYLGAPVATPVDPRHRLVTTKYNPARTWTAENSVGIGGSYLCVYGMEGPGGYQFVGRTLQMWNRYQQTREFEKPWLLRFFDQIKFYEVSHDELMTIRRDFPLGKYPLNIEETEFNLGEYQAFLASNQNSIQEFTAKRDTAFDEELQRWHANGQFHFKETETVSDTETQQWPENSIVIESPVSGSVWKVEQSVGDSVTTNDVLLILESMKMEIPLQSHAQGTVTHILKSAGQRVEAGQPLIVIEPNS